MLSSWRLPQLKACKAILAHIEGKNPVSDLNADFARKVQTAQPSSLTKGQVLGDMKEKRISCAVDTVLTFFTSFMNTGAGFVKRCDLKQVNVFNTEMVTKLPFYYTGVAKAAKELVSLRSDISKVKSAAESTFAPHCWSDLFILKCYLLDHAARSLERF